MFDIIRYSAARAEEWNRFVAASRQGTFLLDRRYMDYHSQRFSDHSLMFFLRGRLYALLPANVVGDTLHSHQGLTYGGLLTDQKATASEVCTLFGELNAHLRSCGVRRVVYKPTPWIYHRIPAEEDLYALFQVCHARLVGRDVSSAIALDRPLKWRRIRQYGAVKARKEGVATQASDDFGPFWEILAANLRQKYGVAPVHTLEEMRLLHDRFPENIRLYTACLEGEVLGGTVVYLCGETMHAQYISASPEGKRLHALDALFGHLLGNGCAGVRTFDFGKSTERQGQWLNEQLIYQKEGFGGRAVCYDTYEYEP